MLARARRSLTLETHDGAETQDLAASLAAVARPGDRVALVGPLGAGKTQFAKGFARGLGVSGVVNSPSFTLMAEYEGRLPMFHLDLYRLTGAADALAGGMIDERHAAGVTLTEWAERLGEELDPDRLEVRIAAAGTDDARRIELTAASQWYERYLEAADGWTQRAGGRDLGEARELAGRPT